MGTVIRPAMSEQASASGHLTDGLIGSFHPTTMALEASLLELSKSQLAMLDAVRRETESLAAHDNEFQYIEDQFSRVPMYLNKIKNIQSTLIAMDSSSADMKRRVKVLHDKCIESELAKTVEEDMRAAEERSLRAKPSA